MKWGVTRMNWLKLLPRPAIAWMAGAVPLRRCAAIRAGRALSVVTVADALGALG